MAVRTHNVALLHLVEKLREQLAFTLAADIELLGRWIAMIEVQDDWIFLAAIRAAARFLVGVKQRLGARSASLIQRLLAPLRLRTSLAVRCSHMWWVV